MPTLRLARTAPLLSMPSIALAAFCMSCASPSHRLSTQTATDREATTSRPTASRTVIDGATLASAWDGNVYDALLRVRPEVLNRVAVAANAPTGATRDVYVNGLLRGDIRELRQLSVTEVQELRVLTPVETAVWFGKRSPVGAIAIRTR